MKLLELAKRRWVVLAVYDHRDQCQVLEFLDGIDKRLSDKMLGLLKKYVPDYGPPKHNKTKAKHLKGDIWEFMAGPKAGAKLRVLYFQDANNIVVCTEAFTKRDKTPQNSIDHAQKLCDQYKADKRAGHIEIVKLNRDDQ